MRTVLKVADNSGVKTVMCIQPLKGKKVGRLGGHNCCICKGSYALMPIAKVKKGEVVKAVVVHAAMHHGCCDGSFVKFADNAVVLIDKYHGFYLGKRQSSARRAAWPIGKCISGPVPHELRKKSQFSGLASAEHAA